MKDIIVKSIDADDIEAVLETLISADYIIDALTVDEYEKFSSTSTYTDASSYLLAAHKWFKSKEDYETGKVNLE